MFVGKGNNDLLIRNYFYQQRHKYKVMDQKATFSYKFKFKWVQTHYEVDFQNLREDQLVNHIKNIGVLTSKTGMLQTLLLFDRSLESHNYNMHYKDFFPETYKLELGNY